MAIIISYFLRWLWPVRGLRKFFSMIRGGELVAFVLYYSFGKTMSAPLLGYDQADNNYYRSIRYCLQEAAREGGLIHNASSGVVDFKRHRGYKQVMELMAWDRASGTMRQKLGRSFISFVAQLLTEKLFARRFRATCYSLVW